MLAEDMLILLRREMEEHQKALAYDETEMRDKIRHATEHEQYTTRHALYWTLTLEMSMAYRRAYVQWCKDAMRIIESSVLEEGPSAVILDLREPHEHAGRSA
jgi:hypothetical protein